MCIVAFVFETVNINLNSPSSYCYWFHTQSYKTKTVLFLK